MRLTSKIGSSARFTLRNDGGDVSVLGSSGNAAAIAVCTSTAALSISRAGSKVSVMLLLPVLLDDVISSTPAIVVNWRSSGLATDAAIVAGSPPGRLALTLIVALATVGRSLIGRPRYATTPNSAMAAISRLVAMGRLMKISETFMLLARQYYIRAAGRASRRPWRCWAVLCRIRDHLGSKPCPNRQLQPARRLRADGLTEERRSERADVGHVVHAVQHVEDVDAERHDWATALPGAI